MSNNLPRDASATGPQTTLKRPRIRGEWGGACEGCRQKHFQEAWSRRRNKGWDREYRL